MANTPDPLIETGPLRPSRSGQALRTLNIIDEYTRKSLAIRVKRELNSTDVIDVLTDLFILRGVPAYI